MNLCARTLPDQQVVASLANWRNSSWRPGRQGHTAHNMRQDRGETLRSLRGQAGICKFLIKCPSCDADVNYTEAMIRDV